MNEAEQEARIVEARLKLRERFLQKMEATPSLSDGNVKGSGPLNRHGMPVRPPGQKLVSKWPVLDLGRQPAIDTSEWQLKVDGSCTNPAIFKWDDFLALPQVEDVSDFHCVTAWSKLDMHWKGVRLADVLELVAPNSSATHIMCYGYDGYSTNLPLEEALKSDVLLVHHAQDEKLERQHGGPVRLITPQLYAWKGCKWICRIRLMDGDEPGFWEKNGYSNTGYPWREERYLKNGVFRNPMWRQIYTLFKPVLLWQVFILVLTTLLARWLRSQSQVELLPTLKLVSALLSFAAVPLALWRLRRQQR